MRKTPAADGKVALGTTASALTKHPKTAHTMHSFIFLPAVFLLLGFTAVAQTLDYPGFEPGLGLPAPQPKPTAKPTTKPTANPKPKPQTTRRATTRRPAGGGEIRQIGSPTQPISTPTTTLGGGGFEVPASAAAESEGDHLGTASDDQGSGLWTVVTETIDPSAVWALAFASAGHRPTAGIVPARLQLQGAADTGRTREPLISSFGQRGGESAGVFGAGAFFRPTFRFEGGDDDGDDDDDDGGGGGSWGDPLHFNDVAGDQSGIRGRDGGPAFLDEARARGEEPEGTGDYVDLNYDYHGVDGDGAHTFGFGALDIEIPDDHPEADGFRWWPAVEVFTLDSRAGNNDAFRGIEFDANGYQNDFEFFGQNLNVGVFNGTGNLRWDGRSRGASLGLSAIDLNYANGDPSADNDNDFSVRGGASAGLPLGGFNLLTDDPDGDGHINYGFDVSYGPASFGLSSEGVDEAARAAVDQSAGWLNARVNELEAIGNGGRILFGGW